MGSVEDRKISLQNVRQFLNSLGHRISAVRHEQYTQKFIANPEPIQLLFLPQSVNTETSIPTSQPTLKLDMIFGTQTGAVKHSSKWCVPSHLVEQFQKHRHRGENNFYL